MIITTIIIIRIIIIITIVTRRRRRRRRRTTTGYVFQTRKLQYLDWKVKHMNVKIYIYITHEYS